MLEILGLGVGKRKAATAIVSIKKGTGLIRINKKLYSLVYKKLSYFNSVLEMLEPIAFLDLKNLFNIDISVAGGGIHSQISATQLALSKAIVFGFNKFKKPLNSQYFLRSDSRIKERKKYGLLKARKASQYSKR